MSEILCYLSGFFTGVGVTCAAFCIYLHRIRKQLSASLKELHALRTYIRLLRGW